MFLILRDVTSQAASTHRLHSLKRKVTRLQAWTGPDVSRKLRLPDFKTIGT